MITIKEDKRSTSPLGINDINLDISTEWSNVNKQEYSILISAMNNKEYEEYINVSDSIELSTRDNPILVYEKKPDRLSVGKKHRVLPNVPKKDRTNLGYQY